MQVHSVAESAFGIVRRCIFVYPPFGGVERCLKPRA